MQGCPETPDVGNSVPQTMSIRSSRGFISPILTVTMINWKVNVAARVSWLCLWVVNESVVEQVAANVKQGLSNFPANAGRSRCAGALVVAARLVCVYGLLLTSVCPWKRCRSIGYLGDDAQSGVAR